MTNLNRNNTEEKFSDESQPKGRLPKKLVSRISEYLEHINSLRVVVFLQFIVIVASFYQNSQIRDNITVHIPPDISNGVVMNLGEIPLANVLTSVSYLWIEMNSWMTNGDTDAVNNVMAYSNYLDDEFIDDLRNYYEKKKRNGELNRQRRLTLVTGVLSEVNSRVQPITQNSWVVYLDVIDEEIYEGEIIKHAVIRYSLLVERTETTVDKNPLGVKIVGHYKPAVLLNEYK